jgi:type IV secretion system protein VirB5
MVKKLALALALALAAGGAHAQILVSDPLHTAVTSTSWMSQAASMAEQAASWRQQYRQMGEQYAAFTGGRGMEGIAGQSYGQRNYLPDTYSGLRNSSAADSYINGNAVLSAVELAGLSPQQRAYVESGRRSAAMAQMASEAGYRNASEGFRRVQSLIDAISSATDAKGIADLQARMQGEQVMVATEQNKLAALQQAKEADRYADEQRRRERALQMGGDIRTDPPVRY